MARFDIKPSPSPAEIPAYNSNRHYSVLRTLYIRFSLNAA